MKLTKDELLTRSRRFLSCLDTDRPAWESAVIVDKVNQYYFTGTMQDAVAVFRRGREYPNLYVRRSFDRARAESPLASVYPIESYREAAAAEGASLGNTLMELESVPFAVISRIQKYFSMETLSSLEETVMRVRSVKSAYELHWQKLACRQHAALLEEAVPPLLKAGVSEAEFVGNLFSEMIRYGYQGITRFYRYGTELIAGQVAFGENSLVPSSFDGPGGALGNGPFAPVGGNRDRKLKEGDLVFVDNGFGMGGYNSDKTRVYLFRGRPGEEMILAHRACMDIQRQIAERLVPGAIPSEIYRSVTASLDSGFLTHFMGYQNRRVKFLGHGIGLHVDEMPVIAEGFTRPLEENMVIALEPKKGVDGVGMVGVEDSFLVTPGGGVCLTGTPSDILVVE